MDGDAGALAGRVEPGQQGLTPDVRVDAAHVVVRSRPHRDRLVDRVDSGEDHRQLARPVQPLVDLLRAEVAQVEQDVAVDPAPLVDLRLLGARDDVAARELHRVRRVALQEALALGVQEVRALAAAALGDQHAGRREGRRVELHHLHILERHADAERQRHPVAGAGVGVRRPGVEPAGAAGGEDHRLRADRLQPSVEEVPADDALAAVVVHDELPREELLVDLELPLHDLLVEDLDEHVAGDVGRIRRPRRARGAEGALGDPAVLGAREDRAPVLELVDVARRLLAQDLDRVLVAEVVGALDGVEGVDLRVVLGGVPERRVDPALRGAGVAARGMDLRDEGYVGSLVVRLDRGAHARAAGADDQDVVTRFHYLRTLHNGAEHAIGPPTGSTRQFVSRRRPPPRTAPRREG